MLLLVLVQNPQIKTYSFLEMVKPESMSNDIE